MKDARTLALHQVLAGSDLMILAARSTEVTTTAFL
jgi:hypothetical protein